MGRWEPNARGRLAEAAMELFQELGYARTTVEGIAARAGLTERTFFRYFADKREVLFSGSADLEKFIVEIVGRAPKTMAPLDAVAAALEATAPRFEERRGYARKRRAVIAAHAELRERELIKLASLAVAIAASLRKRGVPAPTAALAAEAGIAVFRNAFERWVDDKQHRPLPGHIQAALKELRAVTAGTATLRR
ncbi:MAG TPA: TetR family transcriptional regulator [Vicinamibacterales bacterium]|jgi:AcrR family transcriptional regulator|nr:TetR family transcriptional regulator [Vicinamibacterales bacterium]